MGKHKWQGRLTDFMFLAPALALFILIVGIPFIDGLRISFTDWDGFSTIYQYVGLNNYKGVLRDPSIVGPIKNSVFYTVVTVIGNNLLGLLIAMMLQRDTRLNRVGRVMMFMPFIISSVLAGFIWTYLYSDVLYKIFGIKSLLGNPKTVMWGITLIGMWRDIGYSMLIYIAGLQGISGEYLEAARIDGANALQCFLRVRLPMLAPAITVNVTLFLGWGLKVFDTVMAATNGGPGRASETLAIYVYNYAFPYNRAGYGQAAAVLMMLGIFIITAGVSAVLRRREVDL